MKKEYIKVFEEYIQDEEEIEDTEEQDSELTDEQIEDLLEDSFKLSKTEGMLTYDDWVDDEVYFLLGKYNDFCAVFDISEAEVYTEDGYPEVDWRFTFKELLDEEGNHVEISDKQAQMLEDGILTEKTMQKFDEDNYKKYIDNYYSQFLPDYDEERKEIW